MWWCGEIGEISEIGEIGEIWRALLPNKQRAVCRALIDLIA